MSLTVFDHHGKRLVLQPSCKEGGEGAIHLIDRLPDLCAKIYKPAKLTRDQYLKIYAMVINPPRDPTWTTRKKHRSIAWPATMLFADPGQSQFRGFTMPLIDMNTFRTIDTYYSPSDRNKRFHGGFTWKHLMAVAHNVTSAVAAIHEKGHRVGDLREANILVNPQALITLVDCDSFQVVDRKSRRIFYCRVGTAEYLPREIMSANFHTQDIDRYQSDLFALGVLVFQLLMNGFHPYAARGPLVEGCQTHSDKILRGHFAFPGTLRGAAPPPLAPPYEIVPPLLRQLLERCFVAGHQDPAQRPRAADWCRMLRHELDRLRDCRNNANHWYSRHLPVCPWCHLRARTGKDPFASTVGSQVYIPSASTSHASSAPGQLALNTHKVDLGTVAVGKPARFEVHLSNLGSSPVDATVQLPQGSCLAPDAFLFRVAGGHKCTIRFTAHLPQTAVGGTAIRESVQFAVSGGTPLSPLEVNLVVAKTSSSPLLAYALTLAVSGPLLLLLALLGLSVWYRSQRWGLMLLSISLGPLGAALAKGLCTRSYDDARQAVKASGTIFLGLLVAMLIAWHLDHILAEAATSHSQARLTVALLFGGLGGLLMFPWGYRIFAGGRESPRAAWAVGCVAGAIAFALAGRHLHDTPVYRTCMSLILALMVSALGIPYTRRNIPALAVTDRLRIICLAGSAALLLLCFRGSTGSLRLPWPSRPVQPVFPPYTPSPRPPQRMPYSTQRGATTEPPWRSSRPPATKPSTPPRTRSPSLDDDPTQFPANRSRTRTIPPPADRLTPDQQRKSYSPTYPRSRRTTPERR